MAGRPYHKVSIDGEKLQRAIYERGYTLCILSRSPTINRGERTIRKGIKSGEMDLWLLTSICGVIGLDSTKPFIIETRKEKEPMTNYGYDYILKEIDKLQIELPKDVTVDDLRNWLDGAVACRAAIINLINKLKEGSAQL